MSAQIIPFPRSRKKTGRRGARKVRQDAQVFDFCRHQKDVVVTALASFSAVLPPLSRSQLEAMLLPNPKSMEMATAFLMLDAPEAARWASTLDRQDHPNFQDVLAATQSFLKDAQQLADVAQAANDRVCQVAETLR